MISLRLPVERTLAALFVGSAVLVMYGPALRPPLAIAPIAIVIVGTIVRKFPVTAAGMLPAISIVGDGTLFHLHLEAPLRLSTIVLLILLWSVLTSERIFHPHTSLLAGWMVLLLAVNYFTIAIPTGHETPYQDFALLIEGLVLCIVVSTLGPSPRLVLWSIGLSATYVSYYAFFPEYRGGGRPYALALDPNFMGAILGVGLVTLITLTRLEKSWRPLIFATPLLPALVQVQSRGSIIAALLGSLVVLASAKNRRAGLMTIVAIGAFAASAFLADVSMSFGPFTQRRVDTAESQQQRDDLNKISIDSVKSEPIVGIGLGVTTQKTKESSKFTAEVVNHNEYLRFAAESGLPALLALLLLLAGPSLFGVFKRVPNPVAANMAPTGAAVMGFMLFLNSLDNAFLATLAMTVAGTAWSWTYRQGDPVKISLRSTRKRVANA